MRMRMVVMNLALLLLLLLLLLPTTLNVNQKKKKRTIFEVKPHFKTKGPKRKIPKKMSAFKEYYEGTFMPAVQEHLQKRGGWAFINFEIPKGQYCEEYAEIDDGEYGEIDDPDKWTEVPIFFSYSDDKHCKVGKKMMVAGSTNELKQSCALGFKTMEVNEAEGYSYEALYEIALKEVSKTN